ncbi:MAG: hypothetical protein JST80_09610 [Bdellovibrionales bacterium]|nr:hypothetical protein [Bdellovibrionales bacterium]
MNTKFVYFFAILALVMSSFALGSERNHYKIANSESGSSSDQFALCEQAKTRARALVQCVLDDEKKLNRSPGKAGVEMDSACDCKLHENQFSCSVGVSFSCEYSAK